MKYPILENLYEKKLAQYEINQRYDIVIEKLNSEDPDELMAQIETHRDNANWFYRIGKAYSNNDNSLSAIDAFREAFTINPMCEDYIYYIGLEYRKLGKNKLALDAFHTLNEREDGLTEIGAIYLEAGELENALYYLKAVDVSGNRSRRNEYLLARTYAAIGDYYEALVYINRALDLI